MCEPLKEQYEQRNAKRERERERERDMGEMMRGGSGVRDDEDAGVRLARVRVRKMKRALKRAMERAIGALKEGKKETGAVRIAASGLEVSDTALVALEELVAQLAPEVSKEKIICSVTMTCSVPPNGSICLLRVCEECTRGKRTRTLARAQEPRRRTLCMDERKQFVSSFNLIHWSSAVYRGVRARV